MDTPAFRLEAAELIADMKEAGVKRFPEELEDLIRVYLHREKEVSRAKPDSARVTRKLKREVRAFHRKNRDLSQRQIGVAFNIAPGTVSRILNFKE